MSETAFSVYRHERKFLLSPGEALCLKTALSGLLQRDGHSAGGGYFIRSLYFDTPCDDDYQQKLLGLSERRKLRLRLYSLESDTVKLEIKNKQENLSHKETAVLSRAEGEALAAGDYRVLEGRQSATARRFLHLLRDEARRPAVLIDYEREAFVSPVENVRITFDQNLRAAKSTALFGAAVPTLPLHAPHVTILEVKYDRFLPRHLACLLSSCTMQEQSVSKYCTARSMLY